MWIILALIATNVGIPRPNPSNGRTTAIIHMYSNSRKPRKRSLRQTKHWLPARAIRLATMAGDYAIARAIEFHQASCKPANGAGQEQGNFPVGWSEWNDRYRDVFRASQNKLGVVPVTPAGMATRFAGSDDLFGPRGRKPWNSVFEGVLGRKATGSASRRAEMANRSQRLIGGVSGGLGRSNSWGP